MKKFTIALLSCVCLSLYAQNSENYILRLKPRIAVSDATFAFSGTNSHTAAQLQPVIQYYDGLGRPAQTIQWGASPSGKDIIQIHDYDALGQETRFYQPYASSISNGLRIPINTAISQLTSFCQNTYGDPYGYYDIRLEESPLKRLLERSNCGTEWQMGSRHTQTFSQDPTHGLPGSATNPRYIQWTESGLKVNATFPEKLFLEKSTDADRNVFMVFKNKSGRVEIQSSMLGSVPVMTYYIYDEMDRLRAVLPPLAADYLCDRVGQSIPLNHAELKKYIYLYLYDESGNCVESRLPGLHDHPVYRVFDKGGREVLVQDGELRKKGQWLFKKHDAFGRPIQSGLHSTSTPRITLQNQLYNATYAFETFLSGTYSNRCYPQAEITLLAQFFFDDLSPSEFPETLNYEIKEGFGLRRSGAPKGQLTASWICLTDGSQPIWTAYYYDDKNRLIQQRAQNRAGDGFDHYFFALDFYGLISAKFHQHKGFNHVFDETYLYEYDHVGRKTAIQHRFGEEQWKTIGLYEYDELGRLAKRSPLTPNHQLCMPSFGNLPFADPSTFITFDYDQHYRYHIQGGLKQMTSNYYSETLYRGSEYIESLGPFINHKALFNGLITAKSMTYGSGAMAHNSRYAYLYDGLGRLTDAYYADNKNMDFSVRNLSYDKHGNILQLMRSGITEKFLTPNITTGAVDFLEYAYDGNRLIKIMEMVNQIPYQGMQTFNPKNTDPQHNTYNANGALEFDDSHNYYTWYNFLNLPEVSINNMGQERFYEYDASGKKISETVQTDGGNNKYRTYADNVIYQDEIPTYIGLEEGYYAYGDYFSTIRDYQGSICVVLQTTQNSFGNEVLEHNRYDPWGVEFGMASNVLGVQPFKHQGKERIEFANYSAHDHGARMAHNAIGRWTVMDPLMEKYYPVSPYVYCGNNPVMFVDLRGDSISVSEGHQEQFRSDLNNIFCEKADRFSFNKNNQLILNEKRKVFKEGMSKEQKKAFNGLYKAMKDSRNTNIIYTKTIDLMIDNENKTINVMKDFGGGFFYKEKDLIVVDPEATTVDITIDEFPFPATNVEQNSTSVLFHELGERNNPNSELRGGAVDYENYVRKILKLPKRPYDIFHRNTRKPEYK